MFKAGGADGDPEVLQVRHETAFAQHADVLLTDDVLAFEGIDHLHLSGIVLGISPVVRAAALTLFEAAVAAGVSVSFDPNLRLNLWPDRDEMRAIVNNVAAQATLVMPGLGEGRLLTGHDDPEAIADSYLNAGAREVVVKLASRARRFGLPTVRLRDHGSLPSLRSTLSAPAMASLPAISPLAAGGSLQERVDQVPLSAPWRPPGAATWPPCRPR
jgi:hypothetical protein